MSENDDVKENEVIEETTIDEVELDNSDGLKISKDAVATYAGIAISEINGVYNMSGGLAGFTEAISGKKNFSRGIKVWSKKEEERSKFI